MQLTKGAIGNLINRYKAVLKKCHLMNTFGSLAVAGMLVMGGAGVAVAADDVALGAGGSYDKTDEVNHLMGGGLYKDNKLTAVTPVTTDITLSVEGGSISEIIGGSYISGTNADYKKATHGTITTTISDETTSAEFVVGGSKLANNDGATLETGTTAVTINGGTFGTAGETDAYELVMGGNYIKTGTGANGTATTDGSSVTVNGGTFHASVVGGSVAHNYSGAGITNVFDNGNTSVTITGGTFNPSESSLTDGQGGINLSAAVIGGGLAYGANTSTVLGSKEAPANSSVSISGDKTIINGKVVAGSVVANNGGTAIVHGNTTLAMAGGTAHDDLIGGGMVENATTLPKDSTSSHNLNITGDSSVKVTGGKALLGEVIGGNYVKTSTSRVNSAKVANSSVTITGGTFAGVDDSTNKAQYIIGGSKTNASGGGNATTLVEGNSSVLIDGDVTIEDGALIGGSQAKAGNGAQPKATAIVKGNSSVTVNNGNLAGVVGGGIAETYYSTTATAESTVDGTSSVTINGGNVTGNSIETGAVQNNTGTLSAAVVGGGLANDKGSTATVGSTRVTIADGTINGKVVAGGAAINGGSSTVTHDTSLTMTGGKVDGDLIGGGFVDSSVDSSAGTANNKANVNGSTHITVSGGSLVDAEIIGGGSVRNATGEANVKGSTHVTVTKYDNQRVDQQWVQYVLGGGKAMTSGQQTATANVTGSTNVTIGEQGATGEALKIEFGTVAGGGLARAQAVNSTAKAEVANANVTVHSGILSGVAGGGIAESYSNGTADATVTGAANLTINGGTINGVKYKDVDTDKVKVAVLGGGIAKGSKATADATTTNTVINGGTINGHVVAGGLADGGTATVGTANLTITDGTINGNVYADGYTLDSGTANVTTANVTLKGGSIKGKVTVGNATEATITLDGTGAKVTGDDTGDFEGNESSTLAFNNYNGTFEDVAIGFGTLAVAENSNVYVDALVSGQRGSDRPNTGIFGAPTPGEGSGPVVTHPLTITGGGTITANEFHVNPDASVTIEHGNVVADDVKVQGAILTVGKGSASAGFTANNELSFEQIDGKPQPSIVINNLGTATLSQTVVLNDEDKIDTTLFDNNQILVNTGGTLRLDGLKGPLTEDELAALQDTTQGGLLDLGGADLGVPPGPDGTVSYDKVQGITTDSLKDTTVTVTDEKNAAGISGGFQSVKLTGADTELNAKGTLVLAGSQNGDNLVIDTKGAVADLRVGGSLSNDRDTSAVTLGLADANNSGTVRTVTLNAGTGNDATLNVIGAGAAEFTVGEIRANESTNTINVAGATLNTGNITTESGTKALDKLNITSGIVNASGNVDITNVVLANGVLTANEVPATAEGVPATGGITLDTLSGQGAVVADKTLTLQEAYTGKEGDDLTLQADTLKTGAINSTTGDLTIAATNLVTSGETKLVDDTLVADNVALGGALTASGASLVQVQDFGTYSDADSTFTSGALDQAVSVQDTSLMAYGADLAQAQQAVAETGHTGAAYYAGKTLTLTTGGSLTVGDASDSTVAFGSGSLLVVDGTAMNGKTVFTGPTNDGATASVDAGSRLHVDNAVAGGFTVFGNGFNELAPGWTDDNVTTDSAMLDASYSDNEVTVKTNNAHTVFPNLSDGMADAVNDLYNGKLNNVDSTDMGVRFLSRATNDHFLGADKDAAAATIESAARIAFAGAVPQMTKMASDAGTNAVVNRLGFANPADGAQAMDAEGKIVDRNTTGFALWIAPLWQSQHGWGMEADNLDYGFNGNLGGVSLGADYTFENAIRAGITFNIGGGYAESSGGDLNSTENRMSFWGLGAYAGWNYENFGLMADVSYTSTWNDLKQDMDSRMGMGDLEADVQASAISAGLRAEYKLETSVLDVIPHIGVRYMSLNTWGFDAESNGGTVLEGDGFHQDIWTFPVGVTFTKDFTLDSGWSFKPSIDFSVIPAAGDIKAKQDVAFTGLPGSYEVETQMMDYLTWQGGVGLEMGNDTMSFGVNYTLQAGQHTTGHGVFGSFRYEF